MDTTKNDNNIEIGKDDHLDDLENNIKNELDSVYDELDKNMEETVHNIRNINMEITLNFGLLIIALLLIIGTIINYSIRFNEVNERLDRLETDINDASSNINKLNDDIDNINDKCNDLEVQIGSSRAKINSIEYIINEYVDIDEDEEIIE